MGTPERELAGGRQKADRTVCGNVGRAMAENEKQSEFKMVSTRTF